MTPTPSSRVVRTAARVAALAVLASLTPMYFDRWHRGMVVVGAVTAVAVLLADRLTAATTRARWQSLVLFVAIATPAVALLRGVEATILHLGWSMLLVLAFARGTRWPRVLAINVVLGVSLFSIYEYAVRARDLGRRTAEMGWNLAPPAPGDPWVEWRNSEWMSWRDDTDSISRSWRTPDASPLAEGVEVSRGIAPEVGLRLSMRDHAGFFIRVASGRRVTTGTPQHASGTVAIFGGSTVACLEVLDHLTIPSLVQHELVARGRPLRVRNYGVPGARVVHQLARLKTITGLGSEDVVVFFDGNNDALHLKESAERSPSQFSSTERAVGSGLRAIERWSRVFFNAFLSARFTEWRMGVISDEELAEGARDYAAAVDEARRFVVSHGARFVHVLQPNLFTYREPGSVGRLGAEITRIRHALVEALAQDDSVDLASAMDGLVASPYLDWMHVTSSGNAAVARFIVQELTDD